MKVVAYKNLPARLPFIPTAVAYLLADVYSAPEWLWGMAIFVFGVYWVVSIIALFKQELEDIFKKP